MWIILDIIQAFLLRSIFEMKLESLSLCHHQMQYSRPDASCFSFGSRGSREKESNALMEFMIFKGNVQLVSIFRVIWGKGMQACKAPDFLGLHKNKKCVFPLILCYFNSLYFMWPHNRKAIWLFCITQITKFFTTMVVSWVRFHMIYYAFVFSWWLMIIFVQGRKSNWNNGRK